MNTQVKVGIAAAIVAALVALIVLDQKTTPKDDPAPRAATGTEAVGTALPAADRAVERARDEEVFNFLKKAERELAPKGVEKAPPSSGFKPPQAPNEKDIRPAIGDPYVIEPGDTYESIAEKKYGSRSFSSLIADANPNMKANALRVGKPILLPPKPEKVEKPVDPVAKPVEAAPVKEAVVNVNGQKIYTIVQGDTLSGISVKVYNTSRHTQKVYEANKDKIDDPHLLTVGTKLVMPDLPVKGAAPVTGTVPVAAQVAAPAGARTHQVQPSESLWKIAEKYASERGVGILDMIESIVGANPEKLKDQKTLLRLGWELIIPQ